MKTAGYFAGQLNFPHAPTALKIQDYQRHWHLVGGMEVAPSRGYGRKQ